MRQASARKSLFLTRCQKHPLPLPPVSVKAWTGAAKLTNLSEAPLISNGISYPTGWKVEQVDEHAHKTRLLLLGRSRSSQPIKQSSRPPHFLSSHFAFPHSEQVGGGGRKFEFAWPRWMDAVRENCVAASRHAPHLCENAAAQGRADKKFISNFALLKRRFVSANALQMKMNTTLGRGGEFLWVDRWTY